MHLELSPRPDGSVVITLDGEVDLENADDLREALLLAVSQSDTVELHAADLEFMDSAGLSALIVGHRAVTSRHGAGAALVVVDAPGHFRRLLQVAGVDDLFRLRDSGTDDTPVPG